MESLPPMSWSGFRTISTILCFTFLLQLISSEHNNQFSRKFQNQQNTTLSSNINRNVFNSSPKKLSNGAIQLNIIQNVIDKVTAVLKDNHEHLYRNKRGINNKPSSIPISNSTQLNMIENVINKMQEQLAYLNSSTSLSTNDKKRISTLETSIKEFQIILDNFQTGYTEAMQTTADKLETSILIGIAQSIKFRHFSFAEKQLQLTDDSIYEKVVRKVYNRKAGNINLLLSFGGSIQNFEKKFKVYETLYHEMRINGHTDIQKLLQVIKSLRNGILDIATGNIADKCRSFICTMLEGNCDTVEKLISAAFLNDKSWSTVKTLKNETYRSCGFNLMRDVYISVTDEVLDTLDIPEMLAQVDKNIDTIEERILIHEGIIRKLGSNDTLYTNNAVSLARHMKITWDDSAFNSEDWRYLYKNIINKLPGSLRNIVLQSSVCIKNSHFDEYLYAADSEYYNISGYRSVFTWMPQDKHESSEFMWKVTINDNFQVNFVNVKYSECITFLDETIDDGQYVVTSGGTLDWNIEVDGDGVQVHYEPNAKYLFVNNDTKQDDFRRNVFAYQPEGEPNYPFKWELVDCLEFS